MSAAGLSASWRRQPGRQAVARLLIDALTGEPARAADPGWAMIDVALLLAAADEHRIAPAVYRYVAAAPGVPTEWLAPLGARYEHQVVVHLRTMADLQIVADVLTGLAAPWAVVKGPVLAERAWPRPDLRQYSDLDVVVDRLRFAAVLSGLIDSGATLVDRNWPLIERQMRAELTLLLPYGTRLDLHWDLVNDAQLRDAFRFPTAAMLERAVDAPMQRLTVPTLDPADTLLHLCYHTASSGGARLVWLKDVQAVATGALLDWSVVSGRAKAAGLEVALAVVLDRALRTLDPGVSVRRRPTSWALLVRAVTARYPVPALPGDRHTGRLAFESVRDSNLASARELIRRAARRRPPPRPGGPPAAANPLHADHPDRRARTAYLAAVQGDRRP